MKINSASMCETGQVRRINQDSIYSCCRKDGGVFVLADGMGGHESGERASREITDHIRAWMESEPDLTHTPVSEIMDQLKKCLSDANDRILQQTSEGALCGSTVVLLALVQNAGILISAGDSRCYRSERQGFFRKKYFSQMTVDEVYGGNGPQRNRLMNAVGIQKPLMLRSMVFPFRGKQNYLICSDGVYKYCTGEQIRVLLEGTSRKNTEEKLAEIKKFVESNGAGDNYSAFLICAQE